MSRPALALLLMLLGACAGPRPPAWQSDSLAALERFRTHYLAGEHARAQRAFDEALYEIGAAGRLDAAARAELYRCALGTAALDFDACAGYTARAGDATPDDRAYGRFVAGDWRELESRRVPARYRPLLAAADDAARTAALAALEDPLSRLVAAGALFRQGRLSPDGLQLAIDAASAQGYRRPLLALLTVQARMAESAGDAEALAHIRRRLDLLSGSR